MISQAAVVLHTEAAQNRENENRTAENAAREIHHSSLLTCVCCAPGSSLCHGINFFLREVADAFLRRTAP